MNQQTTHCLDGRHQCCEANDVVGQLEAVKRELGIILGRAKAQFPAASILHGDLNRLYLQTNDVQDRFAAIANH